MPKLTELLVTEKLISNSGALCPHTVLQPRAWLASVKEPWDAVVDFTSFQEEDIDQIVCGLKDRTKHYIFVSSDSTYNVCPVEEELAKLLSPESTSTKLYYTSLCRPT